MKNKTSLKWLIAGLVITIAAYANDSYAQVETKRLPDGTIIYSDGSWRKPNGEMKYPRRTRTARLPDRTVRYPDGRVRLPDGTVRYPDGRIILPDGTVRNTRNRNGKGLPPGHAKKVYGSKSARDYAPGHNKTHKKAKDYRDNDDRYDDDRYDDRKEWKNKSKGKNKKDD